MLEPDTLLEPVEPPFLQITLVSCDQSAKELVPVAINNRPEIASRRELVAAAGELLRREQKRPFLPNLVVTSPTTTTGLLAAGNLSAGANAQLNSSGIGQSIDLAAVWQLQNGGIGNIGRIREQRADRDLASIEFTRTVFRVKAEVAQAVARLQTARIRVVETAEGVRQAIESADKNFIGLRETARPAGELLRLDHSPAGSRRRDHRARDRLRAIRAGRERVQHRPVRSVPGLGQPAQWVTSLKWQPPEAPRTASGVPSSARNTALNGDRFVSDSGASSPRGATAKCEPSAVLLE